MDERGIFVRELTTAELVGRLREGEQAAWREATARYGPLLAWVVRRHRLNEQDVEDVIQTTWLRCLESLERLREPDALGAWLITTCRREALRHLRARSRVTLEDATDGTSSIAAMRDSDLDPLDQMTRRDDAALLYTAMDSLPDSQRRLLLALLMNPDAGYRTTSTRLGMPVGSIGPTRLRALQRLRRDPHLLGCR